MSKIGIPARALDNLAGIADAEKRAQAIAGTAAAFGVTVELLTEAVKERLTNKLGLPPFDVSIIQASEPAVAALKEGGYVVLVVRMTKSGAITAEWQARAKRQKRKTGDETPPAPGSAPTPPGDASADEAGDEDDVDLDDVTEPDEKPVVTAPPPAATPPAAPAAPAATGGKKNGRGKKAAAAAGAGEQLPAF